MKIVITSDIHLDHYLGDEDSLKTFAQSFPKGDVLILAGDLTTSLKKHQHLLPLFLDFLGDRYEETYAVPGNHDFYDGQTENPNENFGFNDLGIKTLNRTCFVSRFGFRIGGCFAWYQIEPFLSDATQIKRPYLFSTSQQTMDFSWLSTVKDLDVLVTHVPLSPRLSNPFYAGMTDHNTCFFHDREDLILRIHPKLYVSGHTHYQNLFSIGNTMCVTHAAGYKTKIKPYFSPRVIEL